MKRSTSEVETRDDRFRKNIISAFEKNTYESAQLYELRSQKSEIEINLIQNGKYY